MAQKIANQGLIKSYFITLGMMLRDKAVVLMLIVAPIIYGFYYPWPYSPQIVRQSTIGIIDNDRIDLARRIIRFAEASPNLVLRQYPDTRSAYHDLVQREIEGYLTIPEGLKSDVFLGNQVILPGQVNGAYLLLGKSALTGMLGAVRTVSAGIELKRLAAQGINGEQATFIRDPVPLVINPLYNPNEGYGNYIVPAVSWLILQQTLLIGAALFIGTLTEQRRVAATASVWAGRVLALASINMIMAVFYTGWVFVIQGFAHGGNPSGNLLLIALFSTTTAALGCIFGLWFKVRERALQILTFSSLPLFFISGYSWPLNAMPEFLQYVRWLTPSTAAIQAGVHFNQMDASIHDNLHYLLGLGALGLCAYLLLIRVGRHD